MALTKRTEVDQVVLNPQTGYVGWRVTTIVEEDGVELSRTFHRHSVEVDFADFPGAPAIPTEVEPLRALVHTPDKLAKARQLRQEATKGPKGHR